LTSGEDLSANKSECANLKKHMLSDSQVFTALFLALVTGIFAVRLGTQLYK